MPLNETLLQEQQRLIDENQNTIIAGLSAQANIFTALGFFAGASQSVAFQTIVADVNMIVTADWYVASGGFDLTMSVTGSQTYSARETRPSTGGNQRGSLTVFLKAGDTMTPASTLGYTTLIFRIIRSA